MSDLPLGQITAVVDLKHGSAVHAIAGHREAYLPVSIGNLAPGDPSALLDHYHNLGIQSLYLADLDSLNGLAPQVQCVARLISKAEKWCHFILVDAGWIGEQASKSFRNEWSALFSLARQFRQVGFVAATESAAGIHSLDDLLRFLAPSQIVLGLDYRNGEFQHSVTPSNSQQIAAGTSPSHWLAAAAALRLTSVVVLDISSVGVRMGPTVLATVRQIHHQYPDLQIYSGGGIRDRVDCERFLAAGCHRCLMATALLSPRL